MCSHVKVIRFKVANIYMAKELLSLAALQPRLAERLSCAYALECNL
jgi:hypothetical protein